MILLLPVGISPNPAVMQNTGALPTIQQEPHPRSGDEAPVLSWSYFFFAFR